MNKPILVSLLLQYNTIDQDIAIVAWNLLHHLFMWLPLLVGMSLLCFGAFALCSMVSRIHRYVAALFYYYTHIWHIHINFYENYYNSRLNSQMYSIHKISYVNLLVTEL